MIDEPGTHQLKAVGPECAAVLAEVHASAFPKPWNADDLARTMGGSGAFALAYVAQGQVQGFVIARAMAGEAEILTLAVRPFARRSGVGRTLTEAAAAAAAALGASTMWLEAAVDNLAAIRLYEVSGFQAAGRRNHYYLREDGARIDALIMRRLLNTAAC